MKKNIDYRGFRYPPEIIGYAVWLYYRFTLSFRDIEDLLAERGVTVSYEAIRLWCIRFGPSYARKLRKKSHRFGDHWGCNETQINVVGTWGNTDLLSGTKKITGYRGSFTGYYPNGISLAKWPCYLTNAEFPSSASGGPVTGELGRACGINSTSSEGGGYSTAGLIKQILDSNIPGHFLINGECRSNQKTFRDIIHQYGGSIFGE